MTDLAHFTDEEVAGWEAEWIEGARASKVEAEIEWRRQGKVFAILDDEPSYVAPCDWETYARIPDPETPCDRVIRFDLIGGGQIKSIEHFVPWSVPGDCCPPLSHVTCYEHDLEVTAHCGDIIKRGRGKFEFANLHGPCEINHHAVVFNRGADQEVVDRVAATFRAIGIISENFFALLIGGQGCAIYNRPLRDEISRLIGVGPCCAEQWRIPHSRQAAEKRLTLRRHLLGKTTE